MSKIKVTKEQEKIIKELRETILKDTKRINSKCLLSKKIVNELSTEEIKSALFDGYEVMPRLNDGDWVICEDGYIGEIIYNSGEGWVNIGRSRKIDEIQPSEMKTYELADVARHATPEEIEEGKEQGWWNWHDREVWELRINDEIFHKYLYKRFFVECVFENGDVSIKPVNGGTSIMVKKEYLQRDNFKIVYFAEDKKDQ